MSTVTRSRPKSRSVNLTHRLRRESRAVRPLAEPKSAAELFAETRLFAIVVMNADGSEVIHKPIIVPAVSAAQTLGGLISSLAHVGTFAEAREIDLGSLRFTGRTLGASDLRPVADGKAVQ